MTANKIASVAPRAPKMIEFFKSNGAVEVAPGRFGFIGMNRKTLERIFSEAKCSITTPVWNEWTEEMELVANNFMVPESRTLASLRAEGRV